MNHTFFNYFYLIEMQCHIIYSYFSAKPAGAKKTKPANKITPGAVYQYSEYIEYDASLNFHNHNKKTPPTPQY